MLSIVIADDEIGIIKLCKLLIDYPDAHIIGEAHNGLELLDKIEELQPNTVITDICMPGMTGLELIEICKHKYPDINFIITSGYTKFDYAKKALQLGVWDYLLKPISKKDINNILKKLDGHLLEQERIENSHTSAEKGLEQSLAVLRKKYLSDIWHKITPGDIPKINGKPIFDLEDSTIFCVSFCADSLFSFDSSSLIHQPIPVRQIDSVIEGIQNYLNTINCQVTYISDEKTAALFSVSNELIDSAALQSKIDGELRNFNIQNSFIHASCAQSDMLFGAPENISEAFRQVNAALKWRLEQNDNHVIYYSRSTEDQLNSVPSVNYRPLQESIARQDTEKILDFLNELANNQKAFMSMYGTQYRLLENLCEAINQALRDLSASQNVSTDFRISIEEILSGGYNYLEYFKRISTILANLLKKYNSLIQSQDSLVIAQAKNYIAKHYSEDLSLNQVAAHVYLSPAYFSSLFKKETGTGFTKYLQSIRVNEAKTLLKNSGMKIREIASAVGYKDIKSFNKVFYAEMSVTPSEYRKYHLRGL